MIKYKYRTRSNGIKIVVQRQMIIWDIPLWWRTLNKHGYVPDVEGYGDPIKYYVNISDAEKAVKLFCKKDQEQKKWNEPCQTIKEYECTNKGIKQL